MGRGEFLLAATTERSGAVGTRRGRSRTGFFCRFLWESGSGPAPCQEVPMETSLRHEKCHVLQEQPAHNSSSSGGFIDTLLKQF